MPETLTPAEIEKATGKRKAAQQAAVLARRGVPFAFFGASVSVDRAIAMAHALIPNTKPAGVDFSRVR